MPDDSDLRAMVPPDLEPLVARGEAEVLEGQNALKPVVRVSTDLVVLNGKEYKRGQLLPGSGRYPRSNDSAAVGRATAWKQSATWNEAFQTLVTAFEEPHAKTSVEHLLEVISRAIEGGEIRARCRHEKCNEEHLVYLKPDTGAALRLLERLIGKAAETKNVNVNASVETKTLEVRQVDVRVYDMSEATAEERLEALMKAGVVEAAWLDN